MDYYDHPPSFVETLNAYPSKLEQSEQGLLKETLFKQVIELSFRNGVFHVEVRVRDSSSSYKKYPDGTLDLSPNLQDNSSASPSVCLKEANARAPGHQCNRAAAHAYGVDFYALSLLLALRDHKRVQILSTPFTAVIQYWHAQCFLPAMNGGRFAGEGALSALATERPDLYKHIVETIVYFRNGDKVANPVSGRHMWLGTFLIRSKTGRRHVLEVEKAIRSYLRPTMRVD